MAGTAIELLRRLSAVRSSERSEPPPLATCAAVRFHWPRTACACAWVCVNRSFTRWYSALLATGLFTTDPFSLVTVNSIDLLSTPLTDTTTLSVPGGSLGTHAAIEFSDHREMAAVAEPNLTELFPGVAPKFKPRITTGVPGGPEPGESVETVGNTVNVAGALSLLLTETITLVGPAAASGTVTTLDVSDQDDAGATVFPNFTVLPPWLAPKSFPLMVTTVPEAPLVGEIDITLGAPGEKKK